MTAVTLLVVKHFCIAHINIYGVLILLRALVVSTITALQLLLYTTTESLTTGTN
jgi:hypothetical protein